MEIVRPDGSQKTHFNQWRTCALFSFTAFRCGFHFIKKKKNKNLFIFLEFALRLTNKKCPRYKTLFDFWCCICAMQKCIQHFSCIFFCLFLAFFFFINVFIFWWGFEINYTKNPIKFNFACFLLKNCLRKKPKITSNSTQIFSVFFYFTVRTFFLLVVLFRLHALLFTAEWKMDYILDTFSNFPLNMEFVLGFALKRNLFFFILELNCYVL